MRTAMMVATALALCACTPAPSSTGAAPPAAATVASTTPAAEPNGCPAHATSTWDGGGSTYSIEASTTGANCAEAQATMVIRDAHGALEQSFSLGAADTQVLGGAESVQDMQRRLGEWITPAGASADSTGDLPVWEAGAETPASGGVPFTPALGIGRAEYEALRAEDRPMYCYETSHETGACLAVHNGGLMEIGVQTYAG